MPKMIPNHTIILHRDGKRVVPEIGKPFEFTPDEIDELMDASPDNPALREAVNEDPAVADGPISKVEKPMVVAEHTDHDEEHL